MRGDLVLPGRVLRGGALAVRDGRIADVFEPGVAVDAAEVRDYAGRYVLPGLVDTHVHTLSTPAEGIARATAAAAAGGVTTIVDMPYDSPEPVIEAGRFREKVAQVREQAHVDVGLYATIAKIDGVEAIPELVAAGPLAFKLSLYETDAHRFPRIADGDLLAAFEALAASDLPIVLHAELQEIVDRLVARGLAAGEDDPAAHGRSRPVVSETAAVVKALELACWSGARVHVAHVTHPHGFRLIEYYRTLGARVSGETCAHYLALSEDDVAALGPIAKVNPPIRDASAREGLWADLWAGRVATISTDHAPWALEAKRRPMLRAASGIPGLETFLPVVFTEAMARRFPLPDAVELVAGRPADVFGLGARKGRLVPGLDADLAVLDAREPWTFDAEQSLSSARWSPFHGRRFAGRVEATFLRGRPVYESGRLLAEPGTGRWLEGPTSAGTGR
ncbi:MAG TPA: amidohydrolase family protein [Candidatus Dormibacteraeota bacterium]|nr:amidohydrolase family protein [Candidatus Dormibacteraeota bacterium]